MDTQYEEIHENWSETLWNAKIRRCEVVDIAEKIIEDWIGLDTQYEEIQEN